MSLHGRFVLAAAVALSSATAVDAATARVDATATRDSARLALAPVPSSATRRDN